MRNYHGINNTCILDKKVFCDIEQICESCKIAVLNERRYFKKDRSKVLKLTYGVSTLMLVTTITPAYAISGIGDIVYDPSNYVQNLESAVQAVKQVENQLKQIELQFKSLENEAKNLAPGQSNINGLRTAYNNLIKVDNYMNGLINDYTQAQAAWDRTYPDFKKVNPANMSAMDYAKQSREIWNKSNEMIMQSSARNSLARSNSKLSLETVNEILDNSRKAEGALQAAQFGNELVAAQIVQLNDLIGVVSASAEAQNAYNMVYLQKQSKEIEEVNSIHEMNERFQNKHRKKEDNSIKF